MNSVLAHSIMLLLAATPAFAQSPADDIKARVKEGQKVSVIDAQGRELDGRVASMTTEALTIVQGRQRTDVRYTEIVRIERPDGLKNGAFIGLGIGAALGIAIVDESRCKGGEAFFCGNPHTGHYTAAALLIGGLGAAIGTAIDALIGGNRTVYERGGATRISLSPRFGPGSRGALLAVEW